MIDAFATFLVLLVAGQHVLFLILEMFLWQKPLGLRTFGHTKAEAKISAKLAANQGLYNGFLVAGLIWGLASPDEATGFQVKIFFLSCVAIAGIYGGMSVVRKIFYVQGVPALVALVLVYLSRS